ncbi:MAG: hypothetical protein ABMA13_00900 [Chthoniobacteraceae bacterium]
MTYYEQAIELLEAYEENAIRLAENARVVTTLLRVLKRMPVKEGEDAILEDIKDHVGNLVWQADPDLDVGHDSTKGYEELEAAVGDAVKRKTGKKIEWHPS